MTSEHLQISDILAYRERRLSAEDHTMAARHLIRCADCRDSLPTPTVDEFWNCLMGSYEETIESPIRVPVWIAIKEPLAGTVFGRPAVRNALFASLLGVAILGFSLFLLMPGGTLENNNLVAAVDDTDRYDETHPTNFERAVKDEVSNTDTSPSPSPPKRPNSELAEKGTAKSNPERNRKISGRISDRRISSTRGSRKQAGTRGKVSCGGQRSVNLEAEHTEAGLLLKWEKVRGAVTYSIYLSDLDERLIDHFETSEKTSYLVTAELDPETTYRLRMIATLENGERIVSESHNFTMNELKKGSRSFGNTGSSKKTVAPVRCVEVKQ